jgi:hypothetical protein
MSKSAMQELIELLELNTTNEPLPHLIDVIKEVYLEKEKEQIVDAYDNGYIACDLDEVMEVNKKLTSGDLYYNMNYNKIK